MKEKLIQNIISLGTATGQFSPSKATDTDIDIKREIVDAEYYKAVGQEKIRKSYRASILFDEDTREAKCWEEITDASNNVNVNSGNISIGASKTFFKGKTFGYKEFGKTWAVKKDEMEPGKVVDYSFDVNAIRKPIEQMLAQNNWKLVLVTSRKEASYKKKGWFG